MRFLLLASLGLGACGTTGGLVPSDAASTTDGNSGGTSVSDASVAAGEGGSATVGGADADAYADGDASADVATGRPICGISVSPGQGSWCMDLDKLVFSTPTVRTVEGGPLSPGDSVNIAIVFSNPTTQFINYPCIGLSANNPLVTFGSADPAGPTVYGIAPGGADGETFLVRFNPSIARGTVVHFTAWVDVLNTGCTNGAQIGWDVTVG